MTKGFRLSAQPLLFGGYVHGPQVPSSVCGPRSAVLGLMFMGGKRSKPSTPVGEVPKVQGNLKSLVDRSGNAEGENKEKTEGETNKPKSCHTCQGYGSPCCVRNLSLRGPDCGPGRLLCALAVSAPGAVPLWLDWGGTDIGKATWDRIERQRFLKGKRNGKNR